MIIENDIATWTGVMRPEECAELIEYYEKLNDLHLTASRQTLGDNSAHNKADHAAFLLEQPALIEKYNSIKLKLEIAQDNLAGLV